MPGLHYGYTRNSKKRRQQPWKIASPIPLCWVLNVHKIWLSTSNRESNPPQIAHSPTVGYWKYFKFKIGGFWPRRYVGQNRYFGVHLATQRICKMSRVVSDPALHRW